MTEWWNGLTVLEHVFYYCAIPATFVLVIQTIGSILGIGSDNTDVDIDFDGDVDFDSGTVDFGDIAAESSSIDAIESASSLRFFSIRGIVAFFSLFGWVGIVLLDAGLNTFLVFFLATACGLIGMLVIASMFYAITKLQRSGNVNIKNAIDEKGQVYLTIPANMSGKGKVNIIVQERYSEISAMTKSEYPIKTGSMVRVVGVIDINTLLVEKQD